MNTIIYSLFVVGGCLVIMLGLIVHLKVKDA